LSNIETLLVIGGGIEAIPAIRIAQSMGLKVVISDINLDAPARCTADGFIHASTYDISDTLCKAIQYDREVSPVSGVITFGSDVPLTVAQVAAHFGLPHLSVRTACICSNKHTMKNVLRKAGLRVPDFILIDSPYDMPGVNATKLQWGDKLYVIKPIDSRGARGVIRLLSDVNRYAAFDECMHESRIRQVIVEEWLDGPQISTEGYVLNGKYYHVASIDRCYDHLDSLAPYVIENGGSQPSYVDGVGYEATRIALLALLQATTTAIGMNHGTLKGDIVIHDSLPYIIEVAPRLSGGYMSTTQVPLATGVNLIEIAAKIALGRTVDTNYYAQHQETRGVAIRYFFPPKGKIAKVESAFAAVDKSVSVSQVRRLSIMTSLDAIHTYEPPKEGALIVSPVSHPERAGYVIAVGQNASEAIRCAERVISNTKITLEGV
jgi:biotin carboxylase